MVDKELRAEDIVPKLLPFDAELLRWCVDSIVNMIDGSGTTFGTPAVALGIDIVAAHRWLSRGLQDREGVMCVCVCVRVCVCA